MASLARKKTADLLTGPIWPKVLAFALPLALTSVLQQLFNAADVAVIGQFAGKHAMAAVGSNGPIIGLLVNFFVGLSIGANVVISNFIGQNNLKRVKDAVHTSILVAIISGFIITVIGLAISVPIIELLGVPDEVAGMAVQYLRVYFMGMPFIMLYNFESSIFRSQGDTRTPLICLAISGCINVVLNLFFVIICNLSVVGVALATVIANVVSSGLLFIFLLRAKGPIRIRFRDFRIHKAILINILKIGVPSGIQGSVFSISNLVVQSAINSLGADIMAASSAAFNIEIMAYFVINAFSQSAVTFIGQNYGAGNMKRCDQIVKQTMLLNAGATILVGVLFILTGKPLLHLFSTDKIVIAYGYVRIVILMSTEVVNCVNETLSGVMRGYGYSLSPAIVALVGICGVRILWVMTIFKANPTYNMLMIVYPISWAIECLFMVMVYFRVRNKAHRVANPIQ